MSTDRVQALRTALDAAPDNAALRLMLAEALTQAQSPDEALLEYELLRGREELGPQDALAAARLAVTAGRVDVARGLLEVARAGGVVEGLAELEGQLAALLRERGAMAVPVEVITRTRRFVVESAGVTFSDIGGLAEVKKVLHRLIVLPLARPELYSRYGRRAGGAVLLYGPPGCGKTLLARGIAGECGLPFLVARLEDIVDPYFGVSERNLHEAFAAARDASPCVLFLDELDAIAYARHKASGDISRRLVDQLLQELDGVGSDNDDVLVLAATNAPWDVDDAAQRPGRFDRRVFVPPPDDAARQQILDVLLRGVHHRGVDVRRLAAHTELYSGADLRALLEQAIDEVIDEALVSGQEPPLTQQHLLTALERLRPTTLDWLQRAKDYVEFAGASEKYTDVGAYLKRRDVRKRLGGF